jgi:hypothetical protein
MNEGNAIFEVEMRLEVNDEEGKRKVRRAEERPNNAA